MKAKYDFLSVPNPKDNGQTQILYPKMVSNGTIKWDKLAREIAQDTGFDRGTILGLMEEVEERMLRYLSHGYRVQLGGIGTASVSLKSLREFDSEKEIHAQSICFDKVQFQVSKKFKCGGKLERADIYHKFRQSDSEPSEEMRFRLLTDYLKKNRYITRKQYGELAGQLRTKAQKDLNRWEAEGKIRWEGCRTHRVYLLPEENTQLDNRIQ